MPNELLLALSIPQLAEAEARARAASEVDDLLGRAERVEADKIHTVLELFLPTLTHNEASRAMRVM